MRIHIIACRVFGRELSYWASQSENSIEITWQPQGLHETPKLLNSYIKDSLEKLYGEIDRDIVMPPDYIVLGYGLCSNGVVGVTAGDIPIVVPRCDDCIGVFLGSEERYLKLFNEKKGTYWLNSGWIETSYQFYAGREKRMYEKYVEQFGEDNADYLMEVSRSWKKEYRSCGYITGGVHDCQQNRSVAKSFAAENGWSYDEYPGDERIIRMIADGNFDPEYFLVCDPGCRIEAVAGKEKLTAVQML